MLNLWHHDGEHNSTLREFGHKLSQEVLRHVRNPGFYDPFDVYQDITLINYRGLYQGKLDWMLLRNVHAQTTRVANHDFSASDHKLLSADVVFDDPTNAPLQRITRGSRTFHDHVRVTTVNVLLVMVCLMLIVVITKILS